MSHEILPPVVLALDAQWPPARDGRPAGVSEVGSWSVEREIVGSTLPGNVRARTGLSVGSGSATISQVDGRPLAPWTRDITRRVGTDVPARLYAETDAGQVDLGSWVTGATSGGLTAAEVSVDLIERQTVGKRGKNRLLSGNPLDAGALVAALAAECGFHSVPPPANSTYWALPVSYGADREAYGVAPLSSLPTAWATGSGALGASGFSAQVGVSWPNTVYLTLNVSPDFAWTTFEWTDGSTVAMQVKIAMWNRSVEVRMGNAGAWSTTRTWAAGTPDANWPRRIQIEIQRTGVAGAWTGVSARVRASQSSAWSTAATATGTSASNATIFGIITEGGSISGIQASFDPTDPALYAAPTAKIDPLGIVGGSQTIARWVPAELSPWDAIQAICGANLAAGWVDRSGVFQCRNRDYLAGNAPIAQSVDVAARVEDLGWSVDPADAADRLEITYAPGGRVEEIGGIPTTVYSATEKLWLDPGRSLDIEVPLDGPGDFIWQWDHASLIPPGTEPDAWPVNIFSAFTAETGGSPVNVLQVEMKSFRVSSALGLIRITNLSGGRIWMIDANGAPCIIQKMANAIAYDTTQQIERGLSTEAATNAATVDLSHWVQSPTFATEVADFIWSRISTPAWKAESVRIAFDPSIDIGQVVTLSHPDSDLTAKAFVTKVALAGDPGQIVQTLDVVLLPPTWADFDAAWAASTWSGGHDPRWSATNWDAFDIDPISTTP